MAASSRHLCRHLIRASRPTPAKRKCLPNRALPCRPQARAFTTSLRTRADEGTPNQTPAPTSTPATARQSAPRRSKTDAENSRITDEDIAAMASDLEISVEEVNEYLNDPELSSFTSSAAENTDPSDDPFTLKRRPSDRSSIPVPRTKRDLADVGIQAMADSVFDEDLEEEDEGDSLADQKMYSMRPQEPRSQDLGWWGEDEDEDEFGRVIDDDDEWDESMITSVAESQMQQHREVRQYMRVAAWDMPLLTQFAKPFSPPSTSTPLRFRYTTYLGESHPASSKVVLEFSPTDLSSSISPPLTPAQRRKLIKLVSVRYNPSTDIVRISSEKFEHAAQNKRYLGDLVDSLVKEVREGKDTFEDVPVDLRHFRVKRKDRMKKRNRPVMPERWLMTKERVEELAFERSEPMKEVEVPQVNVREMRERRRQSEREESHQRMAEYVMRQPLGKREDSMRPVDR